MNCPLFLAGERRKAEVLRLKMFHAGQNLQVHHPQSNYFYLVLTIDMYKICSSKSEKNELRLWCMDLFFKIYNIPVMSFLMKFFMFFYKNKLFFFLHKHKNTSKTIKLKSILVNCNFSSLTDCSAKDDL